MPGSGVGYSDSHLEASRHQAGAAPAPKLSGVADHREVEGILAAGAVAVAPYDTDVENFTRFADPGKLKAYLAAGLPIVLTEVPPNARQLAEAGGAEIAPFEVEAFAGALERLLSDEEEWRRRREAALGYARQYDWGRILPPPLASLGFVS